MTGIFNYLMKEIMVIRNKSNNNTQTPESPALPFGQTVLVLEGGGALGAYQLGVYEAMHEAGIEPDWVVGTSIGAINGAIIAGNPPEARMERLYEFWDGLQRKNHNPFAAVMNMFGNVFSNMNIIKNGVPGFFEPNPSAIYGQFARLGLDKASYYSTEPLRQTLSTLVNEDYLATKTVRLTVGAVNARTGVMRYFDSKKEHLRVDHIMASGALPPAFPAVRIDGEPYWDGGIYSNTPVEVVLDDNPRKDSTVFSVHLWNPEAAEPQTLWEIGGRLKDIQFSSRANSHIERQQKIHRLRHIIREMSMQMPDSLRSKPEMKELSAWGCGTTMHLVRLSAPRLDNEDQTKDIDFTSQGIDARRQAGYADTQRAIAKSPWKTPVDPQEGLLIHDIH